MGWLNELHTARPTIAFVLTPGLEATIRSTVTEDDTAVALGSGDVPVLGTPRLLALCEEATVAAVAGSLEEGRTTVGTRVEMYHLAPVPVGVVVVAEARLENVEGHLLRFSVAARSGDLLIAEGAVHRAVVDKRRFIEKSTS
jgi:predicted thioesterase